MVDCRHTQKETLIGAWTRGTLKVRYFKEGLKSSACEYLCDIVIKACNRRYNNVFIFLKVCSEKMFKSCETFTLWGFNKVNQDSHAKL